MHRLNRPIAILACSLTSALSVQAQQVYKCTKADKTVFQQVPCDGAEIVKIAAPAPGMAGLPWDGLQPGMSSQDVRRVVPGTQPEGERLLRKPGIVVAGVKFDAEYHFDAQGRLQFVFADKSDAFKVGVLDLNSNDANQIDFEKLVTAFRGKYGTEVSRSLKSKETGFPGLSASADWSVAGTTIFIGVSPVTATTSTFRIGFNPVRQR